MARRSPRIPRYRLHKPTGQGVVRLDGRDHYLGAHDTPESRQRYDRLIAEWLASGRAPAPKKRSRSDLAGSTAGPADLSVNELLLAYLKYADQHYRDQDGRPTEEQENMKDAVKPVKELYGLAQARSFGPLSLRSVREAMIRSGLARKTINARINRVRRVFRWASSMELVPVEVYQALHTVQGLQPGRTQAPESPGIESVSMERIEAAVPCMPPPVAGMVKVQLLAGTRAGDVMVMRTCDLDTTGATWSYRPHRHKKRHRGQVRVIFLGPKAQEVLKPFLLPQEPESYIFSPARWMARRAVERAALRKTKRQPSQALGKRRKAAPQRKPADRYNRKTYRQAVVRACKKAGVEPWCPLELRHTRATELRALYGVEVARTILGHSKVETTQIYAERDLTRAAEIMGEIG